MVPNDYTEDDDLALCYNLQAEEWEVLQSIHPTICISKSDTAVRLEIPVELDVERTVDVIPVPHHTTVTDPMSVPLSCLPPLLLDITLPPLYPTHSPALIVAVRAAAGWVPGRVMEEMVTWMTETWTDMGGNVSSGGGTGVLYTWVEWIRSGEFLTSVGLCSEDGHIRIPHPSPPHLVPLLLAHATSQQDDAFAQTSFACGICLTFRKGVHCLRLGCGHVFCKDCLTEMWGLHVREGDVDRVGCPEVGCESDGKIREATEDEVRPILSEGELKRWRWLRRKRDLERDPTMVYCPMEYCQEPVPRTESEASVDEDEDTGWARLRTCHSCGYSFCSFCKRTWHGPHTRCPFPVTSKIVLTYLAATRTERTQIEGRYGRTNLRRLVRQHEEDQKSRKWMEACTTECPGCDVRVEKSMGCNHMTCAKCKTHFCYRCGSKISATDPYKHFSTPRTSCFSKLFDVVPNREDEWQPMEAFGLI